MSGETVSEVSTTLSLAPSGTGDGGADGRNSGVSLATTRRNASYAGTGGSTGVNERGADRGDGMGLQSVAQEQPARAQQAQHQAHLSMKQQAAYNHIAQAQARQQADGRAQAQQAYNQAQARQQAEARAQAQQAYNQAQAWQQADARPLAQQAYNQAQARQQAEARAQAQQAYNQAQAQQQANARARAQQQAKAEKKQEQLKKKRVTSEEYRKSHKEYIRRLEGSVSELKDSVSELKGSVSEVKDENRWLKGKLREMVKHTQKLMEENGKPSRTKDHLNEEIDKLRRGKWL